MGIQAREFLVDIDARGEQAELLADAVIIGGRHRFAQFRRQLFFVCGDDLRHARGHHGDAFLHRGHALEQHRFEFFTFTRARVGKVFQHRLQRLVAVGAHFLD